MAETKTIPDLFDLPAAPTDPVESPELKSWSADVVAVLDLARNGWRRISELSRELPKLDGRFVLQLIELHKALGSPRGPSDVDQHAQTLVNAQVTFAESLKNGVCELLDRVQAELVRILPSLPPEARRGEDVLLTRADLDAGEGFLLYEGEMLVFVDRIPAGSPARTLIPEGECPRQGNHAYLNLGGKRDAVLWSAADIVQRTRQAAAEQEAVTWTRDRDQREERRKADMEHRKGLAGMAQRLSRAEAELRQLKAQKGQE